MLSTELNNHVITYSEKQTILGQDFISLEDSETGELELVSLKIEY